MYFYVLILPSNKPNLTMKITTSINVGHHATLSREICSGLLHARPSRVKKIYTYLKMPCMISLFFLVKLTLSIHSLENITDDCRYIIYTSFSPGTSIHETPVGTHTCRHVEAPGFHCPGPRQCFPIGKTTTKAKTPFLGVPLWFLHHWIHTWPVYDQVVYTPSCYQGGKNLVFTSCESNSGWIGSKWLGYVTIFSTFCNRKLVMSRKRFEFGGF